MKTSVAEINPASPEHPEMQRHLWLAVGAGVVATILGIQYLILSPLQQELRILRTQVEVLHQGMDGLVGEQDAVWHGNTLLGELRRQNRQIAHARMSLTAMQRFRTDLQNESLQIAEVQRSYQITKRLHRELIDEEQQVARARSAYQQLAGLRQNIIEEQPQTVLAAKSLQQLQTVMAQAKHSFETLLAIPKRLIDEKQNLELANHQIDDVKILTATLNDEKQNVTQATLVADQLIVLQDEVIDAGQGLETALENAVDLIALQQQLAVQKLPELHEKLRAMTDLHKVVTRVTTVLKPLVELSEPPAAIERTAELSEPKVTSEINHDKRHNSPKRSMKTERVSARPISLEQPSGSSVRVSSESGVSANSDQKSEPETP